MDSPPPRPGLGHVDLPRLARALQASWDAQTSYGGAVCPGNPALGQCYPTARVVQWFFPETRIAKGEVWTGEAIEPHFWNVRETADGPDRIDLSWQQFPPGSVVRGYSLLDSGPEEDSKGTQDRCALLLGRVLMQLSMDRGSTIAPAGAEQPRSDQRRLV